MQNIGINEKLLLDAKMVLHKKEYKLIEVYDKIGWCGVLILVLAVAAVYAATRGIVLALILKKSCARHDGVFLKLSGELESFLKEDQSQAALALMQKHLSGIFNAVRFLKLCATIGPLLGLLGTVTGMVSVFSSLSALTAPSPALLASGIWQALLTTVLGLCLAIPSIVIQYGLLSLLKNFRTELTLCSLQKMRKNTEL